jgi:hypothetical protein
MIWMKVGLNIIWMNKVALVGCKLRMLVKMLGCDKII